MWTAHGMIIIIIMSLSYFHNLVNGCFEFPIIPATLCQINYNTRSSHSSIYVQPYAHSNTFLNSIKLSHCGTLFLQVL